MSSSGPVLTCATFSLTSPGPVLTSPGDFSRTAKDWTRTCEFSENWGNPWQSLESLTYPVKDLESLSYPGKDLESLSYPGKDLSPLECQYGSRKEQKIHLWFVFRRHCATIFGIFQVRQRVLFRKAYWTLNVLLVESFQFSNPRSQSKI